MNKKTLIIDLDEVIVEKFTISLMKEYGIDFDITTFKSAYLTDIFNTDEEMDKFCKFMFAKNNVYDSVPLIKDVTEILQKLNEKYLLYICSDFLMKGYEWNSDKLLTDKCAMLKKHFPFINPSQYIFMRDKHLLKADILIDDRSNNFGPYINQKLLFTAHHNKYLTNNELADKGLVRVNSWQEIGELLL